jgi:large subunit ribosomal protein L13Ae
MFEKRIVIDCRDHLLGRVASTIAKELLNGQQVVAVRCEELVVSGSLVRNRVKYQYFLRKRHNINPKKGPYHYRSPSKILWRTIRGMIPHKTPRGAAAMDRLKVFEGVPTPYDKVKRVVVPAALRPLRLKPTSRYTVLGRLSSEVGWKYAPVLEKLETQRKIRSSAWYLRQKAVRAQQRRAADQVKEAQPELHQNLVEAGILFD